MSAAIRALKKKIELATEANRLDREKLKELQEKAKVEQGDILRVGHDTVLLVRASETRMLLINLDDGNHYCGMIIRENKHSSLRSSTITVVTGTEDWEVIGSIAEVSLEF